MFDHAELQRQIATPVCLDESIHSSEDARHAIQIGAAKVINVKISAGSGTPTGEAG
jgi:O-succinylbenzoate synthase